MVFELLTKLGYRPLSASDVTVGDVAHFLAQGFLNLPGDYAEFLKLFPVTGVFDTEVIFQGDEPSPWAENGSDTLNVLFAEHTATSNDIFKVREAFLNELPPHLLIIGEVEGNCPLCLDTRARSLGDVYIWDRESDAASKPVFYFVCHGFTEFLQRLKTTNAIRPPIPPKMVEFSLSAELKAKAASLLGKP